MVPDCMVPDGYILLLTCFYRSTLMQRIVALYAMTLFQYVASRYCMEMAKRIELIFGKEDTLCLSYTVF